MLWCIMRRSLVVISCNFCVNPERISIITNKFHGIISGKMWTCKNVKSVGNSHKSTQLLITSNNYHLYRAQMWILCHRLQSEITDRYLLWYLLTTYNCYALLIANAPSFPVSFNSSTWLHPLSFPCSVLSTLPVFTFVLLH